MSRPHHTPWPAVLAIVGAAAIFGTTFVTVKGAIEKVPVLPFLSARFAVGALTMMPFTRGRTATPGLRRAGLLAGIALLAAYLTQTEGLRFTDEATSAFITYLLVVFVPLIVAVLNRTMPPPLTVVGVLAATFGLFLLSGATSAGFGRGEVLTLLCAVGFGSHIILLDRAGRHDPVLLNVLQLGVVAVGCFVPGLVAGGYRFPLTAWLAVIYLGVMASAVAFFLQTWAQRRMDPTRAALLLMLEPVFAAALNMALGRGLPWRGWLGGLCILGGITVVELAAARRRAAIDLTGAH
jgi:drug/metabolite transporter (DMT)-like permease